MCIYPQHNLEEFWYTALYLCLLCVKHLLKILISPRPSSGSVVPQLLAPAPGSYYIFGSDPPTLHCYQSTLWLHTGYLRATRKSLPGVLEGAPVRLRCHLRVVPGVGVQKSTLEHVRAYKKLPRKNRGISTNY